MDQATMFEQTERIVGKIGLCLPKMTNKQEHAMLKGLFDEIDQMNKRFMGETASEEEKDEYFYVSVCRLIMVLNACYPVAYNRSMRSGLWAQMSLLFKDAQKYGLIPAKKKLEVFLKEHTPDRID